MVRRLKAGEKKLAELGREILAKLKQKQNPWIEIPIRTLSNVEYDPEKGVIKLGGKTSKRYFLHVAHAKKFMQTLLVASFIKELLDQKTKNVSIRDLYYSLKRTIPGTKENTFDDQSESNPIIEDLEVSLDLLREQMNLITDRKGLMVGNITLRDAGDRINCRRMGTGGWGVPSNVEPDVIKFDQIDASHVLFVEKGAVFDRLNEDKFWKKNNCILITGKGQPSRGVRRLLHRFRYEKGLPIYVLCDSDPWGYYIYSVIKQGSINLAYLSKSLGVPDARYIGLLISDIDKFDLDPKIVTIKLNKGDVRRAKELLKYEWFKPKEWQEEIKLMLAKGYKMELEALSSKGIKFISTNYLPTKLANEDFLA
jgi:DNA topoisomerase-6 subunit A